jgi:hypothetical protein
MKHAASVAIGASPIVTFGALQMFGASSAAQWPDVADQFMNLRFWLTILVILLCGAFGGVSYELLLRKGAIELPHRVQPDSVGRAYTHAPPNTLIAFGIVGRALVGSAAALCILLVAAPGTAHAVIALSVTAGAAAPALIRLMRKQLLVAANVLDRLNRAGEPDPQPAARPAGAAAIQPA